jgi:hypothetical protein
LSSTVGGCASAEDSPINLLLFSQNKKGSLAGMMTSSLGQTMSSNSNYMNVILPLKHIMKVCQLTKFNIASEGENEKKPINIEEDHKAVGGGL